MVTDELKETKFALERDRSIVADVLAKVTRMVNAYRWATEGRGPYEWDDDEYRKEFGNALDDIDEAIKPLSRIASDWTNCPTDQHEIMEARKRR